MIGLTQCVVGVDLFAFEGKGYLRVALEAGARSGGVTRLLRTFRYEPVLANPRKLKAIKTAQ